MTKTRYRITVEKWKEYVFIWIIFSMVGNILLYNFVCYFEFWTKYMYYLHYKCFLKGHFTVISRIHQKLLQTSKEKTNSPIENQVKNRKRKGMVLVAKGFHFKHISLCHRYIFLCEDAFRRVLWIKFQIVEGGSSLLSLPRL